MKEALTAAELAELQLPDLPTTERAIQLRAARESWAWRRREGRGGGREFHVYALPESARRELARRAAADVPIAEPAAVAAGSGIAGLDGRRRDRAAARVALVNQFETWLAFAGLSVRTGLKLFARDWSAGIIAGPEWLRTALPRVSAGSIWNWRSAVQAGDSAALAGQYKGRREQGRIDGDPELRRYIVALVKDKPHVNALHVLKALQTDLQGKQLPSLRRLRAWIARYRDENPRAVEIATDPDMARRRRKPAFASPASDVVRINQRWEMDATPADVMCTDGRYVLVGVIDIATRRARVLVARTSKAIAVTSLLKSLMYGARAWGVPELIVSDNGAEFASQHVTTALAALQIRQHLCRPYDPDGKPFIERFFGTLTRGLESILPGFVGHDVAQRQRLRNRQTFARRMGMADQDVFEAKLTGAELQNVCDDWLAADYERSRHEGLNGRTPFEAAAQLARGARFITDERALDVLLAPAPGEGSRVVGKKGIDVDRLTYIAPELGALVGDRVRVKHDVTDISRIVVFDEAGAFVCVAHDAAAPSVSRAEVQARALAEYRAIDAAYRAEAREEKRGLGLDKIAERMVAKLSDDAARIVPFPVAGEQHTTPALEEAARAAAALADPASAQPRASYLDLPPERQNPPAEVIAFTPPDADAWPGWVAETVEIYEWAQRNPTRAPDGLTPAEFHARIESWRAEDSVLDFWIKQRQRTA